MLEKNLPARKMCLGEHVYLRNPVLPDRIHCLPQDQASPYNIKVKQAAVWFIHQEKLSGRTEFARKMCTWPGHVLLQTNIPMYCTTPGFNYNTSALCINYNTRLESILTLKACTSCSSLDYQILIMFLLYLKRYVTPSTSNWAIIIEIGEKVHI